MSINPTMQPFLLEKPVAHSTASKCSAVLIGRIDSREYIFNSVVGASELQRCVDHDGEGWTLAGRRTGHQTNRQCHTAICDGTAGRREVELEKIDRMIYWHHATLTLAQSGTLIAHLDARCAAWRLHGDLDLLILTRDADRKFQSDLC